MYNIVHTSNHKGYLVYRPHLDTMKTTLGVETFTMYVDHYLKSLWPFLVSDSGCKFFLYDKVCAGFKWKSFGKSRCLIF